MLYFVTFPALWKPYRCVSMQVVCSGCNAKIKVPDKAAGKKIKCPRCATVLTVPMPDASSGPDESALPNSKPELPPPDGATSRAEAPLETPDEAPADETGVTDKPSSSGKGPPPIESKRASWDERDNSDEEEAEPPSRRRSRDDDDDDEEDEGEDRPRKRRRRDEDDDDDRLDVRKRRRKEGASGMAMGSMITGIVSVVAGVPGCLGCCCGLFTAIALICGIIAVILGFMSRKSPGSENMAMTGIVCGFVGIAFGVIGIVMVILSVFFRVGVVGANWQMNQWQAPANRRFR